MPKEIAEQTLRMLLSLWQAGMNQPLPLPLKTSIEFVKAKQKDSASRPKSVVAEYEGTNGFDGNEPKPGERAEMCLSRHFPDYDALVAHNFTRLAQETYQPLIDWVSQYVVVQAHSSSEDVEVGESVDAASGEQA
jgi:exodeoxyribonuclease V gamma subunit